MHQDTTDRIRGTTAVSDAIGNAHQVKGFALVCELCRVMKHQQRCFLAQPEGTCRTTPGRIKVTRQDICFIDLVIGQEPIGGFGIGPVLAGVRDRLSHIALEILDQTGKSFIKSPVSEFTPRCFLLDPVALLGFYRVRRPLQRSFCHKAHQFLE